ncbi:fatty acyl-AMP ligase [Streptomyces sp. FL07-04A]|uniref:fatty acyl-AMP ligase n=1 Tax=Streptomyces sp. FL07-04A TaxID=3028658 RepID=UPI0029BD9BE6|nr:fatty acyl-AMP ligase [Streptomyces sp. FL07-04A]MDX3579870.1 fatty acyl-AMP ligase [Streptomyces sp. FL07-04A]
MTGDHAAHHTHDDAYGTFTRLLLDRAQALGDTTAHVFVHDTGATTAAEHLTYGELDRAARTLAVRLRERGAQGRPVLLLHPPGPDFLKAFAGCLYAGAVAVPAPLPGDRGERLHRVTGIIKDTGAQLVLTDIAHAPDVSLWLATAGRGDVVCLATDVDDDAGPDDWRPPTTGPDDLAFLQYTSGSTSQPRGVMVSHRNLLANQEAMRRALGTTPADRFGGWLPHYHDMGLIAHLLHPLFLGSASVQMAPTAFIKRPVRWLQMIEEHGVTIGGGPNFCYDLCLRRVTDEQLARLDLSRWRLALNGAEPVRAQTLEAFTRRFAAAGLDAAAVYPAYGLAEATLMVSGGAPGRPYGRLTVDQQALERDALRAPAPGAAARTLVSSGRPDAFDVRIVDPLDGRELPAGRVGEIWLRGDSVAQGYWRKPLETAETFHAVLAAADDSDNNNSGSDDNSGSGGGAYLRTGDLGALDGGELYVTGRLKEVIILNGRNIYPQDVEWALREVSPALGACHGAVFTVGADREQLVVVQEVRAPHADEGRLHALACRMQALIGRDFDVPVGNVVLVRPGALRRTTSGKTQRTLMRRLFLEDRLSPLFEVLDPEVENLVRPATAVQDALSALAGGPRELPW